VSAPSGPVQVIPPGLLGALQLKNAGQLPDLLMGTYQPVIELRDWLMQFNAESRTYTIAAGFIGDNYDVIDTVPNDEWWMIHEASATAPSAALATSFSLGLAIQQSNQARGWLVCSSFTPLGIGTSAKLVVSRGGPVVWVPSGHDIRLYRSSDVAPPANAFADLRFTRLPV